MNDESLIHEAQRINSTFSGINARAWRVGNGYITFGQFPGMTLEQPTESEHSARCRKGCKLDKWLLQHKEHYDWHDDPVELIHAYLENRILSED